MYKNEDGATCPLLFSIGGGALDDDRSSAKRTASLLDYKLVNLSSQLCASTPTPVPSDVVHERIHT